MELDRRTYLRSVAVAGLAGGTAGCVGVFGGGDANSNVVLGKPEIGDLTMEQYRGHRYPVWGEQVPDVSVPAPLEERTVSLREVSEPSLVTFFYSMCQTVCPRLVSALANVQDHASSNGYADAIGLYPITFDPARDDAKRLREYADSLGVTPDAPNWTFLRPESKARAKEVVWKNWGVTFERNEQVEAKEGYGFVHVGIVVLVNGDGYVERTYKISRKKAPPVPTIVDDLRAVRTA